MSLVRKPGDAAKRNPFDSLKKVAASPLVSSSRELALLLDVSGSMGTLCDSGRQAVEELESAARQTIARYGGRVKMSAILFGLCSATSGVQRFPVQALPTLQASGGTPMHLALRELALSAAGSHAILMSDGHPDSSTKVRAEVEKIATTKVVHTVACGPGADEVLLRWIAERTGGKFYRLGDAVELPDAFLELARVAVAALTTGATALEDHSGEAPNS